MKIRIKEFPVEGLQVGCWIIEKKEHFWYPWMAVTDRINTPFTFDSKEAAKEFASSIMGYDIKDIKIVEDSNKRLR